MQPHLNRIQTFLAVVECGSFTRAAEHLFISKAVASIHVKTLEEALNVPLLIRNTRGIALTEAGKEFYQDFKAIFDNIQNAFDHVTERHHSLAGRLRITSTTEFGEKFLLSLISQFCALHPQLEVSYFADSALNDLITERIDLAIRLGTLNDSSLKSRRLASFDIKLVASPSWLKQNPITIPIELNKVNWIANSNLEHPTHWELKHPIHSSINIRGKAKYISNTSSAIRSLAISGLGVAVLPEWIVDKDLESGNLVTLFPEYRLPKQDVTVIFPNNTQILRKSRVFIDFLLETLTI
ncbi:LysR family transcriptional regulator [Xenorhabdus hominickii]|uniref:LysR family transcriptional regulator n=1 Tax=Xenorhabdus hominickii TaxID=351679 RepID=A0A2G0QEI9_XENHO|nr:LysR family transcriptional regulator [Xenorhabdus hominickii]AOM41698.1 LysR family transcriptional regulator [Xenorhabdus hominickii]PHM57652.1 transcriptional regulator PtxR [Xenorhabdus hominickii]